MGIENLWSVIIGFIIEFVTVLVAALPPSEGSSSAALFVPRALANLQMFLFHAQGESWISAR